MPKVTSSSGRYYQYKDQKYPSVTTIMSRGIAKPGLIKWAGRFVAEAAVDRFPEWIEKDRDDAVDWLAETPNAKRDTAAHLGTYLHAAVERISLGLPVHKPATPEQAEYLSGFTQFLADNNPKYLYTEFEIYNNEYGYAGTGDAIIKIGNTIWLIDTKTGAKVRPEVALQLAAYRRADFILVPTKVGRTKTYTEVPMPKIRKSGVLHLMPNAYEFVEVRSDEEIFDVFLAAKQMYEWDSALSRVAIREVVSGSATEDGQD